ncbi:MAG: hypothetical protein AAF799_09675 [Myxococcota bacterium]
MRPNTLLSASITALICTAHYSTPAQACDGPLTVETVASFDTTVLDTPESVATDYWGNLYVAQALTGEISRIDVHGNVETLAWLPIGEPLAPCFDFIGGLGALTFTPWGLYVNVNSCNEDDRGVWWVNPWSGNSAKVTSLPTDTFANGIAHRYGTLYISDSFNGRIWQASAFGGDAEIWVEDPLLDPVPNPFTPIGANGLQFYGNEMYVSNSITGQIVAFPIEVGETAGVPRVHATLATPCDDFAFDLYGTLYCATNPVNSILAVYPDGETEVVLEGGDLDGPSSAAFGRWWDRHSLYVTNASFPIYPTSNGNPSVLRLQLDVPGYPFR